MKKIISLLCIFCLGLALTGCSSNKNEEDILTFFKAFHNTLDTESGTIKGNITMESAEDSIIDVQMQYIQKSDLQVALHVDLESGGNRQNDFLMFYIRDGKTYLNSMGTTSQSVLSNLGIDSKEKISLHDPFMNFTDEELASFVKSSSHSGNTYEYTLDETMFSTLLDSYGTVSVEEATLKASIQDDILQEFTFHIVGSQDIESDASDVDFTIHCQISDFNTLENIDFPEDLESY